MSILLSYDTTKYLPVVDIVSDKLIKIEIRATMFSENDANFAFIPLLPSYCLNYSEIKNRRM